LQNNLERKIGDDNLAFECINAITGEYIGYCSIIPNYYEEHMFGGDIIYVFIRQDESGALLFRKLNRQIENNYKYHAPKEGQPAKYEKLREAFKRLAYEIDAYCPDSRDKSTAMTNLETAQFWANASVARNE
jgi:hypothetical protein